MGRCLRDVFCCCSPWLHNFALSNYKGIRTFSICLEIQKKQTASWEQTTFLSRWQPRKLEPILGETKLDENQSYRFHKQMSHSPLTWETIPLYLELKIDLLTIGPETYPFRIEEQLPTLVSSFLQLWSPPVSPSNLMVNYKDFSLWAAKSTKSLRLLKIHGKRDVLCATITMRTNMSGNTERGHPTTPKKTDKMLWTNWGWISPGSCLHSCQEPAHLWNVQFLRPWIQVMSSSPTSLQIVTR